MGKAAAVILSLLGLCAAFAAASTEEQAAVVALTTETFDKFIDDNAFTVVEFFAPWCGHCKRLAPEYEAAAKILREEDGIKLAHVDATVETDLATRFDIAGYPTLKAFRKGKAEEYKGGRTKDAIVQWVRRMTGPSVEEVDKMSAAETLAKSAFVAFVGRFKSKETPGFQVFQSAADDNRQLGKFISVISDEGDDTVVAMHEGEDATDPYKISDMDKLKAFLDVERFPLFGSINAGNYGDYFQNSRDLVWLAGAEEHFKAAAKAIREAAKSARDKVNYVWLNSDEFKDHAETGLGVTEFPSLIVQSKEGRYIYGEHVFEAPKVIQFLQDVFAGKVKRHLISEDIPETNTEPVKVVVGKNFNDVLLQKDKDVFLEVYAPWCGHCKQFEPIYTEFAESMKSNPNVLVAKMDGTKNESPNPKFEWTGFPTVFFVKAGSEGPTVYDGPRTVEGLTEYLKEHGSKPISAAGESKDEL